jgi:hypothetical protein
MNDELSKSQKKIARALIDKGLELECADFIESIKKLLLTDKSGVKSNHELYIKIYKSAHKFDKHIAMRYDGLGGSKYFITVLELYMDDILTDEDLADFDEDVRNRLIGLKNIFNSRLKTGL